MRRDYGDRAGAITSKPEPRHLTDHERSGSISSKPFESEPVLRPQQKHLLSAAENIRDASASFRVARRQLEDAEMDENGLSYIRQTEACLVELAREIKQVADAAAEHNQPFELVLRVLEGIDGVD